MKDASDVGTPLGGRAMRSSSLDSDISATSPQELLFAASCFARAAVVAIKVQGSEEFISLQ